MFSLDAAVAMVEKLLVPVVNGHNAHKIAQLRELAELKGTLRGTNSDKYRKPDPCNICGDAAHPTSACPLMAPASGTSSNSHQLNFSEEMGGGLLPVPASKPQKKIDDANLYIGQLPQSLADANLMELFSRFGPIHQAKVIRDKGTGLSKGYGFVEYTARVYAANAMSQMNGYKIGGMTLTVRIAGILPPPVNQLPTYPRPPAIPQRTNPDLMHHWPCPQVNRPFSGQYSSPLAPPFHTPTATSLFSGDFVTSDKLARFPGYLKSLDPPPSQLYRQSATPPSDRSSQFQFPPSFGGYHMPPT